MKDYVIFAVENKEGRFIPNVAIRKDVDSYWLVRTGLQPSDTAEHALRWARAYVQRMGTQPVSEEHPYPDLDPTAFSYSVEIEEDGLQRFAVKSAGRPFVQMGVRNLPTTVEDASFLLRYSFSQMLEGLEQWGYDVGDVTTANVELVLAEGLECPIYTELFESFRDETTPLH